MADVRMFSLITILSVLARLRVGDPLSMYSQGVQRPGGGLVSRFGGSHWKVRRLQRE